MFAEDLQGDIYDGSPASPFFSPSYFHTDEPPQKRALGSRGSAAAIMGWEHWFLFIQLVSKEESGIFMLRRARSAVRLTRRKIQKPTEI